MYIGNRNFKSFISSLYTNATKDSDFEYAARFEKSLYDLLCRDVEEFNNLMAYFNVDTWLDDDGEYFNEWIIDWGG